MTEDEKNALLDRAERLLPKYGGFALGAVVQASLLLGVEVENYEALAAELDART